VFVKLRLVLPSSRQSAGYVVLPIFIKFQGAGNDKNTWKLYWPLINSRLSKTMPATTELKE